MPCTWISPDALAQPQPAASTGSTACQALTGKAIPAALIGEPTSGAIVVSATYKAAVADARNQVGNAFIPKGTPDYCEALVDIKPVDPAAPVIKAHPGQSPGQLEWRSFAVWRRRI